MNISRHNSLISAFFLLVTVLEPVVNFGYLNHKVVFVGETQTCVFAEQELIDLKVLEPLDGRVVICAAKRTEE